MDSSNPRILKARQEGRDLADEFIELRKRNGRSQKVNLASRLMVSSIGKRMLERMIDQESKGIDSVPPLPEKKV